MSPHLCSHPTSNCWLELLNFFISLAGDMREIHEIYQHFILFWTGERNRVRSNLNGVQAIEVIGITEKKNAGIKLRRVHPVPALCSKAGPAIPTAIFATHFFKLFLKIFSNEDTMALLWSFSQVLPLSVWRIKGFTVPRVLFTSSLNFLLVF